MSNEPPILCSTAILTLNCAAKLERCLRSIQAIDDKVIFDGNSTDATRAIAEKFGARVFKQYNTNEPNVRIKNFTEVRQRAWAVTKHDWTVLIDADEWAAPELIIQIRAAITANEKNKVYLIERRAIIDGKEIKHAFFYPDLLPRLFAKSSGVYLKPNKAVHERLIVPKHLAVQRLTGYIYTDWPDYTTAIKKDGWYVAKEIERHVDYPLHQWLFWILLHNNLRIIYMIMKIIWCYLRFGFTDNLPLHWSWRFVRYELKLNWAITKIVLLRRRNFQNV